MFTLAAFNLDSWNQIWKGERQIGFEKILNGDRWKVVGELNSN